MCTVFDWIKFLFINNHDGKKWLQDEEEGTKKLTCNSLCSIPSRCIFSFVLESAPFNISICCGDNWVSGGSKSELKS